MSIRRGNVEPRSALTVFAVRTLRLLVLAGGLTACGNVEPVAPAVGPITDPEQLYMRLTLDHPAVTLSTDTTVAAYYSLQLVATPRDGRDSAMTGLPAPTFRSSDTTTVRVTPDGLMTAVQPGAGVLVIAELVSGPVTHADTALVNVTDLVDPPQLASFSIHPVAPDSTVWQWPEWNYTPISAFGSYLMLYSSHLMNAGPRILLPHIVDVRGDVLTALPVEYLSLDPTIATPRQADGRRNGEISIIRPGQVRMVARTTAYGVTKADTVTFTVTWPAYQDFMVVPPNQTGQIFDLYSIGTNFSKTREVRIAPYGLVFWTNFLEDSVDITFDDPTNVNAPSASVCTSLELRNICGTGNVVLPPIDTIARAPADAPYPTMRVRQFPLPGIYPYHSTRTGTAGRIVVIDEASN